MSRIWTGLILVAAGTALSVPLLAFGPNYSAWSPAQNIGSVIDPVETDDASGCLSKDGRVMYFFSNRPGGIGRYDIWVTRWNDETNAWGVPINLGPNVNSPVGEFTPALSRDEHWLYFASNRPGSLGQRDLYVSYREHTTDDLGWQTAVNLGSLVNSPQDEFGVTFFENDEFGRPQLFFSSTRGGGGDFDIYMTEMDAQGNFIAPVAIAPLSTAQPELTPAIRHDGLELLFSSARPGGGGGHDIWVSTRDSAFDPWSEPLNAGSSVNSAMDEVYPVVAADGTTLLFFRAVLGAAQPTSVWVSTRTKVHP